MENFKEYLKEENGKKIKPKVIIVNFEDLLTDVMNQFDRWDMEYYEDISNAYEALVPEFKKAAKKVFEKNAKKFDYKLVVKGR